MREAEPNNEPGSTALRRVRWVLWRYRGPLWLSGGAAGIAAARALSTGTPAVSLVVVIVAYMLAVALFALGAVGTWVLLSGYDAG